MSLWRFCHLTLALISSVFLIIASVTGVILAIDAALERMEMPHNEDFDSITLAEAIPVLRKAFPEITELSVENKERLLVKGLDAEWNEVSAYVNPITGEIIGEPKIQSAFIQWVTALHRSLFIHRTGRVLIGVSAFLLILIAASGIFLIVQRQQGFQRFFLKIAKDNTSQFYHVVLGRWSLIPILIIGITGTYLFLAGFNFFPTQVVEHELPNGDSEQMNEIREFEEFKIFTTSNLSEVQKLEFPFSTEPTDYFRLKFKGSELVIDQFSGEVISEVSYPLSSQLLSLNSNLHTGRSNVIWAIILALASINILYFIYSGIVIWRKRTSTQIKNNYKAAESEYILLVGSENGSTWKFANAIHKQLLANKKRSYMDVLNNYTHFPNAKHLVIFTSTHGVGEAPSNASRFLSLIKKHKQKLAVSLSVVGFGSDSYPDFCGFAKELERQMIAQGRFQHFLELHTVNDRSPEQFVSWVKAWSSKVGLQLSATPAYYTQKSEKPKNMQVVENIFDEADQTFILKVDPGISTRFKSGDLLSIYPGSNQQERLYSIGKSRGKIQLVIKLHEKGLGSTYLYGLQPGSTLKARVIRNPSFHFPKKVKSVVMIANGTGIAPFLGMAEENKRKIGSHLYGGFRLHSSMTQHYQHIAKQMMEKHKLKSCHLAFSREANSSNLYVMDLIQRDSDFFAGLLMDDGVIMICGSIAMQRNVELVLDSICQKAHGKKIAYFKNRGQVLVDCY